MVQSDCIARQSDLACPVPWLDDATGSAIKGMTL